MKLTFESNLVYQQEAIQAAVNLFEGQMSEESGCQYSLNENGVLDLTAGIGNTRQAIGIYQPKASHLIL